MMKQENRFVAYLKSIPIYGYIIGVLLLACEASFYYLAVLIIKNTGGYLGRGTVPIIPSIDNNIPFVSFFIIFYMLSYPHWVIGGIIISKNNKEDYLDFLIAYTLGVLIGFIILVSYPTCVDRTKDIWVQKVKNNNGFFMFLWRIIVKSDGGIDGFAYNACPSFHCLVSAFIYLGVHRCKNIKKHYKYICLAMLILISLSTIFTKQHYFIDVIGGISLAIFSYALCYFIKPGKRILEYRRKKLTKDTI